MIDDARISRIHNLCVKKLGELGKIPAVDWPDKIEKHRFIEQYRDWMRELILVPFARVEPELAQLPKGDRDRLLSVTESTLSRIRDMLFLILHSSKMTDHDDLFLAGFAMSLRPDDYWDDLRLDEFYS